LPEKGKRIQQNHRFAGFGEAMAKSKSIPEDEWTEWWDAGMETVLGPCDEIVGHATIPFDIGADNGGGAVAGEDKGSKHADEDAKMT
jgi:hypothetical protein